MDPIDEDEVKRLRRQKDAIEQYYTQLDNESETKTPSRAGSMGGRHITVITGVENKETSTFKSSVRGSLQSPIE